MSDKNSFIVHYDISDVTDELSDEDAGKLFKAMLEYAKTGEKPSIDSSTAKIAFAGVRSVMDRDVDKYNERCAKNKENGSKGGRPSKNQTVISETERLFEKPKKPDSDTDTDTDSDTEKIKHVVQKSTRPSAEEVRDYCKERKNSVDANQFVDFYTAKGWKVGNQPMKDWKAAVRTWEKRERSGTPRGKPNGFNNFEQRKYDYDDLEAKLLAGGTS